jgi:catechol 2,3-dioxygenase-like lactoylglutathione lyase family enzyme
MATLQHAGLTVRNLERSLAFYGDLLGMETVIEPQERRGGYFGAIVGYPNVHVRFAHVAFPGDDSRLELVEYVDPPARGDGGEPRDVGVTHVCLVVADVARVHERLRTAGIEFYSRPVTVDEGPNAGGIGVYLRDPDGITVELFQPPA